MTLLFEGKGSNGIPSSTDDSEVGNIRVRSVVLSSRWRIEIPSTYV